MGFQLLNMNNYCKLALDVIEIEGQAILELRDRIDARFAEACELLIACKGRIIVTGMGKSGHIAGKIAATLASTGSPSFYMHPGEASHGDLGMITAQDVVLAISNSGNTQEIVTILPLIKRLGVPLISLTGDPKSTLAQVANVNLDISINQEACPLGLAPTTSTTVTLVMGDALAIALLDARGFSAEDFALSHPGGALGKRLLLKIDGLCHKAEDLPVIHEEATVSQALIEITAKKLGMTCVTDARGVLTGVFTDGDLRRFLHKELDIKSTAIKEVMSKNCQTVAMGMLAAEALSLMQDFKITSLVVVNEDKKPQAVLHLHDLLKAGVI